MPESKIILTACTESQSSEFSSASQGFCSIMERNFRSYLICLLCFLRNWYVDEPSCGSEICVVMYHQPSAPPGVGGPYMFQWNDDRCNMKNNFICKYSLGNESFCFKKQPAPSSQEEVWGDSGIDVKTISVSNICRYLPCDLWILRFL